MDFQSLFTSVGDQNRCEGEDLVPGRKFGVKYPSVTRRKSSMDYVDGDGNDSLLLSQDFNWEEHKPPVVPETENHDSFYNTLVNDFKVPRGIIPISNFKSRLEIQGLMHPDDWMNKCKKRKKAKESKEVTRKGEPQDITTLIKNKHQLMYGDDTQPSQPIEQNQNSQHLPTLNSINYGAGVARHSLMVNGTDINSTSNLTKFNETPFFNLSHNYSSKPLMALPFNLGYNSSSPSMYPRFPSITSGLPEGILEVLHSTECKTKNDSTVFRSMISNDDHDAPDDSARSNFVCQRNEVSGTLIPLDLDVLEDIPSNGSHRCHPETFQHLSGVCGSLSNRGLVSLDDCDQIYDNDFSIANNLSAWEDQERMQNPSKDITNYSDREVYKAGLESLHDDRKDLTKSENYCHTSFMSGSYSPVLGSSFYLTKRKHYSRSVRSALNAMKENTVNFYNDDSSFIHGENNSLSRPLNPSCNSFVKSPIQLKNTLGKVSFDDDHEVEFYLQKNGDVKDSFNYIPATFDKQQTCHSPDLFASQDPLFYNHDVNGRDVFVKDDADELFSNSQSGNITHYQSASDDTCDECFPGNQAALQGIDVDKSINDFNTIDKNNIKLDENINLADGNTPPDSATEFSPKFSIMHTEAELLSQNIIITPGNNEIDKPRRVTTTEELLELYTSS
ncbi:uncharacterized protein LOC135202513 isoform X2 [Macrobrachium nipponense]|uniref:uncharacterized protein LOC135202513 isoform X2 n=1 Tax=Macrobrachium nipponense TaxID=159736 RepID=UPI0030C84905